MTERGPISGGYRAAPDQGSGPGLVVVHGQWGLDPHTVEVCDRLAAEGFVVVAPDRYGGETVTDPAAAHRRLRAVDTASTSRDLAAATEALAGDGAVRGEGVGVIGFGPGGGLALLLAGDELQAVKARVTYHGFLPAEDCRAGGRPLTAAVQGHYAGEDPTPWAGAARTVQARLAELGDRAEVFTYPAVGPGFFDGTRADGHDQEAASLAWTRTLSFLRAHLG